MYQLLLEDWITQENKRYLQLFEEGNVIIVFTTKSGTNCSCVYLYPLNRQSWFNIITIKFQYIALVAVTSLMHNFKWLHLMQNIQEW